MSLRCGAVLGLVLAMSGCAPEVVIGYAPMLSGDAGFDSGADAASVPEPLPEITWASGGHPGNELQRYLDFGTWRGRPLDLAHVFPDRGSWDGVVTPAWPVDMFDPFEGKLILSLPPYPDGMGNLQDCAAGMYTAQWVKLGSFLVEHDRGDSILRLAWGPNDTEHYWQVPSDADGNVLQADVDAWIGCFQSVVDAVRSTAPAIQIDWSFNPIGAPLIATFNPYLAYPGDDYVDFVGLEVFDMYPPSTDQAQWQAVCDSPTGLCTLAQFARAHGKKIGIAEWAVVGCGPGGVPDPLNVGGDNPFFVRAVVQTFADNADVMAYEAYFEDNADVCSNINGGTSNPNAAAIYRELYGPRE